MPNIVKNTTFSGPLDLIAPHSCRGCGRIGEVLCKRCKNYIISQHQSHCPQCKTSHPGITCPNCPELPPIYIVGERSGLLGQIVQDYKYHSIRALAYPLAELLDAVLPAFPGKVIIVPLPTIGRHVRARGFDHTHLIAKRLTKLRGPNYRVEKLLLRGKDTIQVGANQQTRLSQAATAYTVNPRIKLNPAATYLLLDDIWTTGASMHAAINQLQKLQNPQNLQNLQNLQNPTKSQSPKNPTSTKINHLALTLLAFSK